MRKQFQYFRLDMTSDEARILFQRLSMKFHPDMSSGNSNAFIELKEEYEAYKTIKDYELYIKSHWPPKIEYREVVKEIYIEKPTTNIVYVPTPTQNLNPDQINNIVTTGISKLAGILDTGLAIGKEWNKAVKTAQTLKRRAKK